jgi:hypothetical protein
MATHLSFAQCQERSNSLNYIISGGGERYGGYNFQFYGNETTDFLNALQSKLTKPKGNKNIIKFKNIQIDGIDQKLTFIVHRGMRGTNDNCHSHFNTFKNKKDEQTRLSNQTTTDAPGILIYVRRGGKNALHTKEEANLVKQYLLSLKG